jgi:hypothetical protein
MKKLLFFLTLLISIPSFSQDERTVTLVVNGQGKTQDEAKQNALRSAIEQAFGAFISSQTEILNDKLVKDEIVSVANGNIKSYQKISEIKIDDQNVMLTLSVVVTLNKLKDFIKNKGFAADFNGDLFGINVLIKNFNKENEVKVMYENTNIASKLITNIFDYKIKVDSPKMLENNLWGIGLDIQVFSNENSKIFFNWLQNIIKSISLTKGEISEYKNLNMEFFKIRLIYGNNISWEGGDYYFRDKKSIEYLNKLYGKMIFALNNYYISNSSDLKYGKFLFEDPQVSSINDEFLGVYPKCGGYEKYFYSGIPNKMKEYDDNMVVFFILKKGIKVISFKNVDVLDIVDIKKITEYKINPKKY